MFRESCEAGSFAGRARNRADAGQADRFPSWRTSRNDERWRWQGQLVFHPTAVNRPPLDKPVLPADRETGEFPSYRIMVVDDNHASAKNLARLLEKN